jgi:hypothetical protein
MTVHEPRQLMGTVGRIAHENQASVGKPTEHQHPEPDHVLGRSAVSTPLAAVRLLGLVEGDKDG